MAVLTFKSSEYKTFPTIMREYASFMFTIKGNSEKTVCEYLLDLRTFFRYTRMIKSGKDLSADEFEKISISTLDIAEISEVKPQTILDYLMYANYERKNSSTTRMRKLSALKSFFKYMHGRKHFIDTDPTQDIDAPKKKSTLPKFLTLEESVRLLETVRNDTSSRTTVRDYAIITLFLNTGMRLSELCGIDITDIDNEMRMVKVTGKGAKERIIYLNNAARDAVISYLKILGSHNTSH